MLAWGQRRHQALIFVGSGLEGLRFRDVGTHRNLLVQEVAVAVLAALPITDDFEPSVVSLLHEHFPDAFGGGAIEELWLDRFEIVERVAFGLGDVEDVHDPEASDDVLALVRRRNFPDHWEWGRGSPATLRLSAGTCRERRSRCPSRPS